MRQNGQLARGQQRCGIGRVNIRVELNHGRQGRHRTQLLLRPQPGRKIEIQPKPRRNERIWSADHQRIVRDEGNYRRSSLGQQIDLILPRRTTERQ